MTRKKIRDLVGCTNPAITQTFKKVLAYGERGIPEEEWKLTEQQAQIYEIYQFEDKFLNVVFPHKFHLHMCHRAADKATSKESYIKDYAYRCLKYSQYLIRKEKKRAEGLEAMLAELKKPTEMRGMIEAIEYDEDFAFKLITNKECVDKNGKILTPREYSKMRSSKYEEVYPYQDLCEKALEYTKLPEQCEFIHDCMDLTRLIIARGVRE